MISSDARAVRVWRASITAVALTLAALGAACNAPPRGVSFERAALVVPAGGSLAVLYFTVHNGEARDDTIRAVRVEGAEAVTMHAPRAHATGVVDPMADAPLVVLPSRSTVRFAPGGTHAMVRMSGFPLRRGTTVRMVLLRARGDSTVGSARVVEYSDLDSVLAAPSLWRRLTKLAGEVRQATSGNHCDPDATPDPAMGRELYLASGCASCHGPLGHGDGPVAKTLNPPPRDFRDSAAFKNGISASAIAQTIATGVLGGGAMPAHPHLNESERQSLALYLISLRPVAPTRSTTP